MTDEQDGTCFTELEFTCPVDKTTGLIHISLVLEGVPGGLFNVNICGHGDGPAVQFVRALQAAAYFLDRYGAGAGVPGAREVDPDDQPKPTEH